MNSGSQCALEPPRTHAVEPDSNGANRWMSNQSGSSAQLNVEAVLRPAGPYASSNLTAAGTAWLPGPERLGFILPLDGPRIQSSPLHDY